MFDIGFSELTLLAIIGLLVLGPERLPAVARVIGGYLRKARRTWATVRAEIEAELSAEEIRRAVAEPAEELKDLQAAAARRLNPDGSTAERSAPRAPPADGDAPLTASENADRERP